MVCGVDGEEVGREVRTVGKSSQHDDGEDGLDCAHRQQEDGEIDGHDSRYLFI